MTSLLLLLVAPVEVWSAFVNLFNMPLLIAMFCGEFAWRTWRHGAWPRERLIGWVADGRTVEFDHHP